jgi:hypothetical protein
MEARGRRFSGGFPGYEGPALPRAMRSSRVLIASFNGVPFCFHGSLLVVSI